MKNVKTVNLKKCSLATLLTFCSLFGIVHCDEHIWVAQIDGGSQVAQWVADAYGLINEGQIPYLKNKFVFRLGAVQPSLQAGPQHSKINCSLSRHPEVAWVSYQTGRKRAKRDLLELSEIPGQHQTPRDWQYAGIKTGSNRFSSGSLSAIKNDESPFIDPFWPRQWYLHDARSSQWDPRLDLMGVATAWLWNFTGQGVTVAVVDDGVESDHPDLIGAFDPAVSYDYARGAREPRPVYFNYKEQLQDGRTGTWHGTRCSGVIAMTANNTFCGVGIAFNARIGGVKILEGEASDLREARGLTHALDKVHVYSSSWGPSDDGATMEGPRDLAREALRVGAEQGRGGLGAIYVWASGNGGGFGDNCNCDGYSASVYTLTVSSVSQSLESPWYAEDCSATMAAAYSSGADGQQQVVSTDLRHQCAVDFSGTSAAAPMVSGMTALALEANPGLTWRELQHAVIWTSQSLPLRRRRVAGWHQNAAGHRYHHRFGFGIFNVAAMIQLTAPGKWSQLPEAATVELGGWDCENGWIISQSEPLRCELEVREQATNSIRYLEHVQLGVTLGYTVRGALAISLTSGDGSRSQLLTPRRKDTSDEGIRDWDFLTVHFWGENPTGRWRLLIEDQSESRGGALRSGSVQLLRLRLHGTASMPPHRVRAGGRHRDEEEGEPGGGGGGDGSGTGAQ